MAEANEAVEAVEVVENLGSNIRHEKSNEYRHSFEHDGLVHAHRLPDEWEFVGFGDGWFAISKNR